ncbi:hypothetical protein F8A87_09830 [Betaproteobacteria bacterium SCN2]|jgi:hypothetical protein|nr:hypothetical protein F8A87_09830 [Betaproteobacteria bacterium SCN2]
MFEQASERYELSPLKLWSPLQRQLAACGQTKGTPQQWIGTIRNLQKKGVSSVEIEWSGILSMLGEDEEPSQVFDELVALAASLTGDPRHQSTGHPPPVLHIDELIGFLNDKPPCELVLQRLVSNEYTPLVQYVKQVRPEKLPPSTVRKRRREVRLLHYRDRTFGICIWLHVEVDAGLFGRHSYWSLSVPRGRKKLSSEPVGRRFANPQSAMAYGRKLVNRMAQRLMQEGFVGQTKKVNQFAHYALPWGEQYTEWLITAPNLSEEYWGPHFDIPNIIAHVRTTLRMTPQGARLLVLEEIQSDWNQQLREAIRENKSREPVDEEHNELDEWDNGLAPPPFNPYLNHWLEAALRMMMLLAASQGYGGIAWLPGKLHAERFPWANAEGLKTFYDRFVPAAVEKLAKSWGTQTGEAHFTTLSRNFDVRKVTGKASWLVFNRESDEVMGEEFADPDKAEEFRRSMEVPVSETVNALYLHEAMADDIRKNGLPYLGAVGKRPLPTSKPYPKSD